MKELLRQLEDMALCGYGVMWHQTHKEYRPFSRDGESIEFWHDPDGCSSEDFTTAVHATHAKMLESNQELLTKTVFK